MFYSSNPLWHGSFSYSYRFLVDLTPGLALGTALVWEWIRTRRWRSAVLATLCAVSVGVGGGRVLLSVRLVSLHHQDPANMRRFFDWRDLEVVQCLKRDPVEPDGLRMLRGMLR